MKSRIIFPLSFFVFILYIIALADSADYNFAFAMVGSLQYGDKIAHALLYGIMAFALNYGLDYRVFHLLIACRYRGEPISLHLQWGAIFVFIFAFLEELSQYYIPSRSFDMLDLLADIIGIVLFSFYGRRRVCNTTI